MVLSASANCARVRPDVGIWTRLAGAGSHDFGCAVAADGFGSGVVAGATQGTAAGSNAGRFDLFIAKYDAAGNRLWARQRGTTEREFAHGVATDIRGDIYVTGYTGSGLDGNTWYGSWDVFLMKFDSAGNWQWTRQDGTGREDEGRAITTDSSGNVFITGCVRGEYLFSVLTGLRGRSVS